MTNKAVLLPHWPDHYHAWLSLAALPNTDATISLSLSPSHNFSTLSTSSFSFHCWHLISWVMSEVTTYLQCWEADCDQQQLRGRHSLTVRLHHKTRQSAPTMFGSIEHTSGCWWCILQNQFRHNVAVKAGYIAKVIVNSNLITLHWSLAFMKEK